MSTKPTLTDVEWHAVETALNQCLAGFLDGFDEGSPEYGRMERAMSRALAKVQGVDRPEPPGEGPHAYCTEDDCPCFAAGVLGVGQQLAEAIHSLNDVEQGLQGTLDAAQDVRRQTVKIDRTGQGAES